LAIEPQLNGALCGWHVSIAPKRNSALAQNNGRGLHLVLSGNLHGMPHTVKNWPWPSLPLLAPLLIATDTKSVDFPTRNSGMGIGTKYKVTGPYNLSILAIHKPSNR